MLTRVKKGSGRVSLFGLLLALLSTAQPFFTASLSQGQLLQKAGPYPGPAVGRAALAFDLRTLDGNSISLQSFHGKPLVINFFASWCDPCREEMPLINELASKSAKDGYTVLGIAVEDTRAAVTEFAREAKLVFPIALDLNSRVKRTYRIFGPPATFFIDSQGVIRDIVLGPITAGRMSDAMKKLRI